MLRCQYLGKDFISNYTEGIFDFDFIGTKLALIFLFNIRKIECFEYNTVINKIILVICNNMYTIMN